jgi:hypothetical protein
MELIEIVVILLFNLLSLVIGTKLGQKVVRGEDIEIPVKSPLKALDDFNLRQELKKEEKILKTIENNIDIYDGTPDGQQDIPR